MLQRDEGLRSILTLTEEAETGEKRNVVDAGPLHGVVLDALDRVESAVE